MSPNGTGSVVSLSFLFTRTELTKACNPRKPYRILIPVLLPYMNNIVAAIIGLPSETKVEIVFIMATPIPRF